MPIREGFAGPEAVLKRLRDLRCIVGVDGRLDGRREAAQPRAGDVRGVRADVLQHSSVVEVRLSVGTQPPDVARDHIHDQRQFSLARSERLLRADLVVDIEVDRAPFHDCPLEIPRRRHPSLHPAIDTRAVAPAISHGEGLTRREAMLHAALDLGNVLWVQQLLYQGRDPWFLDVIEVRNDRAEIGFVALVEANGLAGGAGAERANRQGVDHLPKLPLSLAKLLLGSNLFVDVVTQPAPLNDPPRLAADRFRSARHPAMYAVRTTQPMLDGERFAGVETTPQLSTELLRVVRMDTGVDPRSQPCHSRSVGTVQIQTEELDHALVEKHWLAIGGQLPNVTGHHVQQPGALAIKVSRLAVDSFRPL